MQNEYKKVVELTQDIKMVMLTTLSSEGALHSRPMTAQQMDDEGNLWFFTSSQTGKAIEIEDHPQVNLAYSAPEDGVFVSVSGTAQLVKDKAKIEELWNPGLKAWFPDGPTQADIALLKIKIDYAEYWDAPLGRMVQLVGMVKAAITGQAYRPSQGEHGQASFIRH